MQGKSARRGRLLRALAATGCFLALLLVLANARSDPWTPLSSATPLSQWLARGGGATGRDEPAAALLHRALERARAAGAYQIDMSLDQTVTPERAPFPTAQAQSAHFEIEGRIAGPDRARFSITPGRTSFALARRDPQEFLVVDGVLYQRAGERWVRAESAPALIGIDGAGLSLAAVARDAELLEPGDGRPGQAGPTSDLRRVGFKLYPEDVRRQMLAQQGQLSAEAQALARIQGPAIHGTGELWIDASDRPVRLVLNLSWVQGGEEPLHVRVASSTDYYGFGQPLPPQQFDPTQSPDGQPLPELSYLRWLPLALAFVAFLGLLAFCWLLRRAAQGVRRAAIVTTTILLAALLAPALTPVAEAAGLGSPRRAQERPSPGAAPGSELAKMLEEMRRLAALHRLSETGPGAALNAQADEDGDGLPNGYELSLGTNPFYKDTDYDGLSDYDEINGVPCEFMGNEVPIVSNPVNPDSNYDGLKDGDEYWRGTCSDGYKFGYVWHDDNDRDGVPDGLDLSPFSASRNGVVYLGGFRAGPNLTFESLDQDPNPARTVIYPFYVEIQIRPKDADSLRWAYKHLFWPGDDKAAIQNTDPIQRGLIKYLTGKEIGTSGKLTLIPLLQATLRESDLPSDAARGQYGVGVSRHKDDDGNPMSEEGEALYDMTMPLVPVERGGQVYAFQAKMLHDRGGTDSLTRKWRDMRLKWAVVGDVLMPDANGEVVPSPDGGYGLVVYDEPYHLTGLQVSRQGGASVLVAGALPGGYPRTPYDDGPIALLRAGLEAQFLTGRLDMAEIKRRFDTPNSASDEERWGIPQNQQYRVVYDSSMHYPHLDEALATTTMTTTRQLLDEEFYGFEQLQPTLLLASEQRTSTVNLDDDPTSDYLDISINTCLKPLVTSRTLKLQTYAYQWEGLLGRWGPLSLDDVLQRVENDYAAATDPGYAFYYEELTILKMATTAWHVGMTAAQRIGQQSLLDLTNVLTDPEMVLNFLDKDGLLPSGYKAVVDKVLMVIEAGGPIAWLEQQWNTVVGVFEDVKGVFEGSYVDWGPPSSRITVIKSGEGESSEPSEPAQPLDKQILGWTQTAISVLNLLASIYGEGFFADAAQVLTQIVQVYQKIRALWDAIKAIVDSIGKPVAAAVQSLSQELSALAKPMALIGLVLAVGFIWITMALQLGDVGPSIALTLVVKAIVETVLVVVLFVVAAIFPYGTIVAIAIGLIKLIEGLIGFTFDPVSLLLDWLFGVESIQRVDIVGDPQIGQLTMKPLDPGGGQLTWRGFRLKLPSIITMRTQNEGDLGDLKQSWAEMHVGRFADGEEEWLCTGSDKLFNKYKDALKGYWFDEFHAQKTDCVIFRLPREDKWYFTPSGAHLAEPAQKLSSGAWQRQILSSGYVDVNPGTPQINGRILLDISMDVAIRYDECSTVGGCDEYIAQSTSPPSVAEIYLDIMPSHLEGLWNWSALKNYDPDGDGLTGYISPWNGQPVGPDAYLCPGVPGTKSIADWDVDGDGLSDRFERERDEFDPCKKDTDGDGLEDGQELLIGTKPEDTDSDNDGLSDRDEVPYDNGFVLVFPWTIPLQDSYPGLPNPPAFPNPRRANIDNDHRNDGREKAKRSSPNAFDPIPVGDPLALFIGQAFQNGGGTGITVSTSSWQNDEAVALAPTLTISLPVSFADRSASAGLKPPLAYSGMNFGVAQPSGDPNVLRWTLPPISLNRYLGATLTGIPALPTQPVSITVQLVYSEGAKLQVATAAAPLRVNTGGPNTSIAGIAGAVLLDGQGGGARAASLGRAPLFAADGNEPVIVQGTAEDPERVAQVFVCLTAASACTGADWKLAHGRNTWSYSFDPPSDGVYSVRAYAVDAYGLVGPTAEVSIGVDRTPPNALSLDLNGTVYLSTTTAPDGMPVVTLTGQASDGNGGAYVSGVDTIGIAVNDGDQLDTAPVDNPGAASSGFTYRWRPPVFGRGSTVRAAGGIYRLTVGVRDAAGNAGSLYRTLDVVIDDTPPAVRAQPPQTSAQTTFPLSGLADDTALLFPRRPAEPFSATLTLDDSAAQVNLRTATGKALIVGDVTGDLIDDVVLLVPAAAGLAPVAFRAGLFFGQPDGFSGPLSLDGADVLFQGEFPVDRFDFPADAAGVGDVNGDGVGDLLLGDPSGASGAGLASLVLGRRGAWPATFDLSTADWRLSMAGATGFGGSVSPAGDVNGDGLADFLVGAASYSRRDGVAWLFLGREQGAAPAHRLFQAPRGAGLAPPHLAGLGDADGDGLSDFLIAGQGVAVALVNGRPDDAWPEDPVDLGVLADALFQAPGSQQTVSPGGDVNGDGLRDMLIGDPDAALPHVYVVYGRRPENGFPAVPATLALDDAADASFAQAAGIPNTRLGAGLAALGDVDQDGRDDFAFGQPGVGRGPNRAGIVLAGRLALTRQMPVEAATYLISGTVPSQLAGSTLSAGDVTGDRVPDLLVGAPGEPRAHLFPGGFAPGGVAGIDRVEIGLFGPVTDPTAPYTATLPTAWQATTLSVPGGAISPWSGQLTATGAGDYRVYARTWDRAGHGTDTQGWYLGNVWVNTAPASIAGGSATLEAPALSEGTRLTLSGGVSSARPVQHLRAYNGYRWSRRPPATGAWSWTSTIPRHDLYRDTFRVVARDAFGHTLHASRALAVDTLVETPRLTATLPVNVWQTDAAPSLTISWPSVADAGGVAGTWAAIDTVSNTVPTAPAGGGAVTASLNEAGIYYGHVRVQDGAGNEALAHIGPFLVNRSRTPSVILPDGYLDFAGGETRGGEYPDGTLLNYDPYAVNKPAALWGTWNGQRLYLGVPGAPWGKQNHLVLYLDTQGGGLSSSLDLAGHVHTLPFAADFALAIGGAATVPYTLYAANGGVWTPVAAPQSYVVMRTDTEIVLDRSEMGANGAVGLLAYAENRDGVWAVLPGGARPTTAALITGTVAFNDSLYWSGLSDGVRPGDGQNQVHAPVVTILPARENALFSSQTTSFQVTVRNPDVGDYVNVPFTVTADSKMVLTGVSGAVCRSCPPGSSQWELLANVKAGGVQTVTVQAQMQGAGLRGVYPVPLTARLRSSGLSTQPQAPAAAQYVLDHGVAVVDFVATNPTRYAQSGQVSIGIMPKLDLSTLNRCLSQVEANTGAGWQRVCALGECSNVVASLSPSASQTWQVRVSGANGRVSEARTLTVVADDIAPTAQISTTTVLTRTRATLEGLAWDDFPTTRTPQRVEVSLNGGRFRPARLSQAPVSRQRSGAAVPATTWRLPLQFAALDGKHIRVTARAVDEAGNVGSATVPITVVLDNVGPTIGVTRTDSLLTGTVRDGSGVAAVEVSLDGGAVYQAVSLAGEVFAFDLASGSGGGPRSSVALVRARDIYGNVSSAPVPLAEGAGAPPLYLPLVQSAARVESTQPPPAVPREPEAAPASPGLEWQVYLPVVR